MTITMFCLPVRINTGCTFDYKGRRLRMVKASNIDNLHRMILGGISWIPFHWETTPYLPGTIEGLSSSSATLFSGAENESAYTLDQPDELENKMKRGLLIFTLLFVMIAFFPQDAQAISLLSIRFHPCINAKGLYTLKVEVVESLGPLNSVSSVQNGYGLYLIGRKNGGEWKNYGPVYPGWLGTFWGNPEGTTFDFYITGFNGFTGVPLGVIVNGFSYYSIKLQGTEYPHCEICKGEPLFKMYLLTRPDSYCLLISEVHPSVESQKALCFPGTDWVATNTPCEGYVCDEDCWECDYLGYERLSLKELRPIYKRHLSLIE
jgi:hypothetical protein